MFSTANVHPDGKTYNNEVADLNSNLNSATSWTDDEGSFQAIYIWKADAAKRFSPVKVVIDGMPFIRHSVLMQGMFVGDQVRLDKHWLNALGTVVGCVDGRVSVLTTSPLNTKNQACDGPHIWHFYVSTIKEVNGVRVEPDEVVDNMIKVIQSKDDRKAQSVLNMNSEA